MTALMRLVSDEAAMKRWVTSAVADDLGILRKRQVDPYERRSWTAETAVGEEGLGADSLMRLELASRLSQRFGLDDSGLDDFLLLEPKLGGWVRLVQEGLRRGKGRLRFWSSGSLGQPKPVVHQIESLGFEVEGLAKVLPEAQRIVSMVPAHHIYGFIFSVLGPAVWNMRVEDLSHLPPGAALRSLRPGDRFIATPFIWRLAVAGEVCATPKVFGVTSTAPMPHALHAQILSCGVESVTEIYGSTETAGLGWRLDSTSAFQPLPHLEIGQNGVFACQVSGRRLSAPDVLEIEADGRFRPVGRLDGKIQVAGSNVDLSEVAAVLQAAPGVADCAVRVDRDAPEARLKAFVVPKQNCSADVDALASWCAARLPASARPVRFDIGEALPRNSMGKLRDWP